MSWFTRVQDNCFQKSLISLFLKKKILSLFFLFLYSKLILNSMKHFESCHIKNEELCVASFIHVIRWTNTFIIEIRTLNSKCVLVCICMCVFKGKRQKMAYFLIRSISFHLSDSPDKVSFTVTNVGRLYWVLWRYRGQSQTIFDVTGRHQMTDSGRVQKG